MSVSPALIFALAALVSGFGTLAGFGGAVLLVPVLTAGLELDLLGVVAGCLVATFPAAALATGFNLRRDLVDIPLALAMGTAMSLGAVGGAHLADVLPGQVLRRVFAAVLLLLAARMMTGTGADPVPAEPREVPRTVVVLAGGVTGVLSGMMGVGGGFLVSPLLARGFGYPPGRAAGTSLAMVTATSAVGGFTHLRLGNLDPELAWVLVPGFLTGALAASTLAPKLADATRTRVITGALLLGGLAMLR